MKLSSSIQTLSPDYRAISLSDLLVDRLVVLLSPGDGLWKRGGQIGSFDK